jgi:hypothetical protein
MWQAGRNDKVHSVTLKVATGCRSRYFRIAPIGQGARGNEIKMGNLQEARASRIG